MKAGEPSVVASRRNGVPSVLTRTRQESVRTSGSTPFSIFHSPFSIWHAPSAPFRVNHEPQSHPTTRSVSSGSRTPLPLASVPNATSTLLEGVARQARSNERRPAASRAVANGTFVTVSVSAWTAGGNAAGTATRPHVEVEKQMGDNNRNRTHLFMELTP